MSGLQFGQIDDRQEALAGVFIELLEAEVRKHAVLPYHRDQIGSDAHHQQVQQRDQALEGHVVALGIGLDQLEADGAA